MDREIYCTAIEIIHYKKRQNDERLKMISQCKKLKSTEQVKLDTMHYCSRSGEASFCDAIDHQYRMDGHTCLYFYNI